jgi:hypothetical protein
MNFEGHEGRFRQVDGLATGDTFMNDVRVLTLRAIEVSENRAVTWLQANVIHVHTSDAGKHGETSDARRA